MNIWKIFGRTVTASVPAAPELYQIICVCNRITNGGKTTEIVASANQIMASSPEEAYGLVHPQFLKAWPVADGYQMHQTEVSQIPDSLILARASALGWTRSDDGKTAGKSTG